MKKGSYLLAGETLLWINRIILTVVVLGIVFGITSLAISRDINVNDAIADLIIRRTYYSSSCFAFEDVNVEPGVIDLKKFNEFRLKNCLAVNYPIKVELERKAIAISNTKTYNDDYNLCKVKSKNKKCLFTNRQYVLVQENGKKDFDILKAEVIIK